MPIPIACPGCGHTEKGPETLKGKRLKCKRCHQGFVVGGESTATTKAPAKAPAKPPAKTKPTKPASDAELDFDEGDGQIRAPIRRGSSGPSVMPLILTFVICLLVGGGGAAGVLYMTKPSAESASNDDESKDKAEKPSGFSWIAKGGKAKND